MENLGLVKVLTAQEVQDAEMNRMESDAETDNSQLVNSLSVYVEEKWSAAKEAKIPVEDAMLLDILQREGEYPSEKLAEIREAEQPEIFINITETKCRNATAWVKDIINQPGERIFSVDPTPIPELPEYVTTKIQGEVIQQVVQEAVEISMQTGIQIDANSVRAMIISRAEEIEARVKSEVKRVSKKMAEKIADRIDDDYTQGGFYQALMNMIDDIIGLRAGILKGPVFRKEKIKTSVLDQNGKITRKLESRIVPQYERRSPFCIYPSPKSTTVDGGYLFDVISLKPGQLFSMIGIEGFREDEIRAVLEEFRSGGLDSNWLGLSDAALEGLGEVKPEDATSSRKSEHIYCLEMWDEIPGKTLIEWGMEGITDRDEEYSCCVWKIGTHIIKAMLNFNISGKKPFYKTSFVKKNNSFWGGDIPDLIADCQQICNACARNILANIGIGALPMFVLDMDRIAPGASHKVWPGKVWKSTGEQMAKGTDPVTFVQPVMVTEKLMNVCFAFSKVADEHSGVPAYAHGDSQVGGAGNTASGLHQLIQSASRGIKDVIRNIDMDVISPATEAHYEYLLDSSDVYGLIGDHKVSAKGTSAVIAKEQQATRKIEFLQMTGNPIDLQEIGSKNRRKMLFAIAKSFGIELDEDELPPTPAQPMLPGQAPPPALQQLDQAGNPTQGTDTREFNKPAQQQIPGRKYGGPVEAGKPYVVGENAPELFVPKQDGHIIPFDPSTAEKIQRDTDAGYDLAGYIRKHGIPDQSKGQHLTDEFKLPHHITFSTDSIYSNEERQGGKWERIEGGKWQYTPSKYVLSQHPIEELQRYFMTKEPDSVLNIEP